MKVIIVGSDKIFSIENFYVKYLREGGVDVVHFTAQNIFYKYYDESYLNKVIFRIGISKIFGKINEKFKEIIQESSPDIIWIFKGMEILPSSLKWAKDRNIKLVNYNPDNPFLFSGKGSGNTNVTNSISLYDLHFTYSLSINEHLRQNFNLRTAILPFGFDVSEKLLEDCSNQQEIIETCFVGNPDSQRAKFITALAEKGISIALYGNNWKRFVDHPLIKIHDPIYGDEQWKTLRKYRVQLNLMRIHNEDSHNMRTFEVPGIGGIMVAPLTKEHSMFFKNQQEAFFFKEVDGCVNIINEILNLSSRDAANIRESARRRSLDSGYGYRNLAKKALLELEALLN